MKKVVLSLLLAIACVPMAFGQNKAGNLITTDTTVCGRFHWIDGVTYTTDTTVMYREGENVYVLNLTMLPSTIDTANAVPVTGICSALWNDKEWKTPGTFLDTLTATNGCDSIIKIEVTLGGNQVFGDTASVCGFYVTPWDDTLTASVTCIDSAITATYCTYTATLDITVKANVIVPTQEVTAGCSYVWNGILIRDTLLHTVTLTAANGCDSTLSLRVTSFNHKEYDTVDVVACDQYILDNDTITTSGLYTYVDTVGECEFNHSINLTIVNSFTDTASVVVVDTVAGCRLTWYGHTYTFGDTNVVFYGYASTVVGGCDSLVAIRITSFTGTQRDTVPVDNCGKYTWHGTTYTQSGVYADTNRTSTCVEINYLNLTLVDNYDTVRKEGCEIYGYGFNSRVGNPGEKDSAYFTRSGIYDTDTNGVALYSTDGNTHCRTNHTLILTIKDPEIRQRRNEVNTTVCDRYNFSFNDENKHFDESTDTTLIYQSRWSVRQCYDSIATFHVVVKHKSYKDYNEHACDSYFWPFTGETYTTSTTQTKVLDDVRNAEGCDSVGRLTLVINYTPEVTITGDWHVQPGETAHLKAVYNNSDHPTFQWYKNNVAVPASQGGTRDSLNVTGTSNTDIRLETTSNKGCMATNWITVTFHVGIDDVESLNVNLYPNPASRFVNVESADVISEVEVYNTLGQQVIRRNVNAASVQLDLGALTVGTYTLRIVSANGDQATRKFIVNK